MIRVRSRSSATAAFERAGLEAALYGGLALAAYGEPRETRDADLAVASVTVEAAQAALSAGGIDGVIAFSSVRFTLLKVLSTRDKDLEGLRGSLT